MTGLSMVIIGPSRGGFTVHRSIMPDVGTVEEALEVATREAAADGADGRGVTTFLNGADLRFSGPHDRPVGAGDVLTVIYPSTDT